MATEPTGDSKEEQGQAPEGARPWGYLAWRMWCAGNRNKAAIHRILREQLGEEVPKDWKCVDRAIARESKIARKALDIDETDALSEYIAGLEEQFGEADRIMRQGVNDFAKLGGLNAKLTLLEKLAAAKGVVTKRDARKHDVDEEGPLAKLLRAAKRHSPEDLARIAKNGDGSSGADGGRSADSAVPAVPGEGAE